MRLKGERITIRLPEKDLRLIDSFLEEEVEFSSRSELLRIAAKELMDRKIAQEKGHPGESYVPISNDHIDAIDYLVKKGRFKSQDAALFEIVRDYLEALPWDKIEKAKEKLQEIKYQLATAKMMEKEIEKNYLSH
ncbi:MAG: ribbon-helix-helix domain-containing protein [Thermoplasmata archaeon]